MNPTAKPVLGMILKGFPRISETFISNEILLLEQLGFRVHIFSMRRPRESFSHKSIKEIRAPVDYLPETLLAPLPRFLFHNIILAGKQPVVYAGALKTAARRFLRTRKSATLKHLFQAGYLVNRLLPGSQVVHLHSHFAHSPTSVALFAARLTGLPFSFTAHAKDIYTSNARQLREKIDLARFVITCTEFNRQHLTRLAEGSRTPIYRFYHGIDMGLFSGPRSGRTLSEPYRLLTVARLTPKKGLATVFKALRILHDQGVPIKHTLIGDGEDRDKVQRLVRELGLGAVTQWHGTLPHHEVLTHYQESDLFVIGCEVAENGDRDGIPNVLVESMAMGVPVVATRVSAIPELVEDGRTGLLVEPGQPETMAHVIKQLLTDEGLRQKIIPAARARVEAGFDNRTLITGLADVFKQEKVFSGDSGHG
jgi:glycosyltransferase involved in cell wall biosynthesis